MMAMLKLRNMRSRESKGEKSLEYTSVQKAIAILLSFLPDNKPAGILDISKSLGLNKSTVSRLTHVLAHYDLLQQDAETQKYELGRISALLGTAVEVSQNVRLTQLGRPYVEHLRDTVAESVCLEALSANGRAIVLSGAVGPSPLTVTFPESNPLHITAGVKAILAFSDHEFSDSMIASIFARSTGRTAADSNAFKDQLKEVRERGIAYDRGEGNSGVHTVSVAVMNHLNKPVAALSICVPPTRVGQITDAANIELLKNTAMILSGRLFYEDPKR